MWAINVVNLWDLSIARSLSVFCDFDFNPKTSAYYNEIRVLIKIYKKYKCQKMPKIQKFGYLDKPTWLWFDI